MVLVALVFSLLVSRPVSTGWQERVQHPYHQAGTSVYAVLPDPSLEGTLTGKPRWPRSGVVHHPLRGQRVSPARAPQLKR